MSSDVQPMCQTYLAHDNGWCALALLTFVVALDAVLARAAADGGQRLHTDVLPRASSRRSLSLGDSAGGVQAKEPLADSR